MTLEEREALREQWRAELARKLPYRIEMRRRLDPDAWGIVTHAPTLPIAEARSERLSALYGRETRIVPTEGNKP